MYQKVSGLMVIGFGIIAILLLDLGLMEEIIRTDNPTYSGSF